MIFNRASRSLVFLCVALPMLTPASAITAPRYTKTYNAIGDPVFTRNPSISKLDVFTGNVTSRSGAGSGGGVMVKTIDPIAVSPTATIAVAATGVSSAANILTAVKVLSGGPIGIAAFAIPLVADWLLSGGLRPAASGPEPLETRVANVSTYTPFTQAEIDYCTANSSAPSTEPGYTATCQTQFVPQKTVCGNYLTADQQCYKLIKAVGWTWSYKAGSPTTTYSWKPVSIANASISDPDKPFSEPGLKALTDAGGIVPMSYAPGSGYVPIDGPALISSTPVNSSSTSGDVTTKTTSVDKTALTYGTTLDPETGRSTPTVTGNTQTTITTTTINNVTGETKITNTTVADKPAVRDSESAPTDTPLPGPPKLYKQKYPEGLTGVWNTQRALMVTTPLFTLAKNLMPSVAMSGSCPTMPINLTFSSWANFGTKDVAPPCQVWDWGKAITIVSALLLARSLIFGG